MKRELFAELMASMVDVLDHAKGKRELRTTVLPPPLAPMTATEVQRVRKRLNASQAVFARYLNVSTKLVQAWEADRRTPDGPALVLLRLGERDPAALTATGLVLLPLQREVARRALLRLDPANRRNDGARRRPDRGCNNYVRALIRRIRGSIDPLRCADRR